MVPLKKVVRLQTHKFFGLFLAPLLLISTFWLIFMGLTYLGLPFPQIKTEKFLDLGFFSLSIFGLIIFLTMTPFQTVAGKLSPIFYARIFNAPSAHFGIYVLMWSFIISFAIVILEQVLNRGDCLSLLFISLVTSIIFAILFHRFWVLRCLYQPYIVYKYIETLKWDESNEEIWLELFECTFKAIKQGNVSDAKSFVNLMAHVYDKCKDEGKSAILKEDLLNLHTVACELRPIARFIEEKWPFLHKSAPIGAISNLQTEKNV